MNLAANVGAWSKDTSAKKGRIIVGPDRLIRSTGYNGFVRGLDDDVAERNERPAKYIWTEHAERNAVYNAARLPEWCRSVKEVERSEPAEGD